MNIKQQNGQALIAGMALVAVAGVMLFFIFNSGRTVNEKLNLVSAADAAAYSSAQITARQLNFMAYTNRVMVANEAAIGHMVSYQAEVDVVTNAFANMSGIVGGAIKAAINYFGAFIGVSVGSVAQDIQNFARGFSGAYIVGVSANNAMYSGFLVEEYNSLLGVNGIIPPREIAAAQVAQQYEMRGSVSIVVNDSDTLDLYDINDGSKLAQLASKAKNNLELCSAIMFYKPGQSAGGNGNNGNNPLNAYCNSNGNGSPPGAPDNPMDDAGAMLSVLQQSTQVMGSADWVNDRNMSYSWWGNDATRSGSTQLQWQGGNNGNGNGNGNANSGLNWVTDSESLVITDGLPWPLEGSLFKMEGSTQTDAEQIAQQAQFGFLERSAMSVSGLCKDIDCSGLNKQYQSLQSYPVINPWYLVNNPQGTIPITVFLTQKGLCNDEIGIDGSGNEISGFSDNYSRYESNCNDETEMIAYSVADVYFKRPTCLDSDPSCTGFSSSASGANEQPNLFNPFWQAKLGYYSLSN